MDSKVIKNYISLSIIKWLGLPYRQKENLYPLVTILKDPIMYRDRIIHFKTGPFKLELEGRHIVILFNVLLLGKDEAVLGMLFL